MNNLSSYALEKLLDLYYEHSHEVGSHLKKSNPYEYEALKSTDCITYVINVLTYAFEKQNNTQASNMVRSLGAYGTKLAKYLVNEQDFKAIYINPDVDHPRDGDEEHTYSAHIAYSKKQYYNINLSYMVTNYNPTSQDNLYYADLNKDKPKTILNKEAIKLLEDVEFGFGVSRGGKHTWLYSKGLVYEVHWNSIGADLYEASPLKTYNWLSGVIVIPEEQNRFLEELKDINY